MKTKFIHEFCDNKKTILHEIKSIFGIPEFARFILSIKHDV